jgi:hypothetical protein
LEGFSPGLIRVLSQRLPGGAEENDENLVRIAGVLIEIRTDNFPNINSEGEQAREHNSSRWKRNFPNSNVELTATPTHSGTTC